MTGVAARAIEVTRKTNDIYRFTYNDHLIDIYRSDYDKTLSEDEFLVQAVKLAFKAIDDAERVNKEMDIGQYKTLFEAPTGEADVPAQDFAFVCKRGDVG